MPCRSTSAEVGTIRRHCSVSKSMMAKESRSDESVDVDEVPDARDADGMTVARSGDQRRDIAGVVLGRPETVRGTVTGVKRIHSLPGVQSSLK